MMALNFALRSWRNMQMFLFQVLVKECPYTMHIGGKVNVMTSMILFSAVEAALFCSKWEVICFTDYTVSVFSWFIV
jgi:hypothetical protein